MAEMTWLGTGGVVLLPILLRRRRRHQRRELCEREYFRRLGTESVMIPKPRRWFSPNYDSQNLAFLRAQTAITCQQLEALARQLETSAAKFQPVEETYRTKIQPIAYALVEAMVQHLPPADPQVIPVIVEVGTTRNFAPNELLRTITVVLGKETASTQVKIIARALDTLLGYLPKPEQETTL